MTFSFSYKQISKDVSQFCHAIHEAERDIETALTSPRAMDKGNRIKSEFKAVAGFAGAIVGCAEANPIAVFCSAGSISEGLYDLRQAGHKYRVRHPSPRKP